MIDDPFDAREDMAAALLDFIERKADLPNGVAIERTWWFQAEDGHGEWRAPHHGEDVLPAESRWEISWGPKMGNHRERESLAALIAGLRDIK